MMFLCATFDANRYGIVLSLSLIYFQDVFVIDGKVVQHVQGEIHSKSKIGKKNKQDEIVK